MSKADVEEIVASIPLPSDQELHSILSGSAEASGSTEETVPAAPEEEPSAAASRDDVPMFSRITDDLIVSAHTGALVGSFSDVRWLFGGGDGGGGGGRDGRGGAGAGDEGFRREWSLRLAELLPLALALSLALPPEGLRRLVCLFFQRRARAAGRPTHALGLPSLRPVRRTQGVVPDSAGERQQESPEAGQLSLFPRDGGDEEVLEWDPAAAARVLTAWPVTWLPHDGAAEGTDRAVASVLSAAGPPLPSSSLAAVAWLSKLGPTPQHVAAEVQGLVEEVRRLRDSEARLAAKAMAAAAVSKVLVRAEEEERRAREAAEAEALAARLREAEDAAVAAAVHRVVSVAVAKVVALATFDENHAAQTKALPKVAGDVAACPLPSKPPRTPLSPRSLAASLGGALSDESRWSSAGGATASYVSESGGVAEREVSRRSRPFTS